ncbi:MAG TPA: sugar ABC transporter permease [Methylomirabilota bacterium]|jgi:multiple sugar transport system permease protein|nr:sugar ABC transporter permease [Methylomirabilota bacterium]
MCGPADPAGAGPGPAGVRAARGAFAERHFRYVALSPAVLLLLLIGAFPVGYNLVLSFQRQTMFSTDTSFAGLVNYRELLADARFWQSIGHTVVIAAVALPLQLGLGLAMAQLFAGDLPGRRLFTALLLLPVVVSPIVAGAAWRLFLDNAYGPVNQIIGWFAGRPVKLLWTVSEHLVYPTVILVEVWQHTPFVFLLCLAAILAVDKNQVEAAQIDGASGWVIFRRVVLPAIAPVVSMVMLIRFVDIMRIFDMVLALTEGGPGRRTETLSLYTYVLGFQDFSLSYTGAVAFVTIALMSTVLWLILGRLEGGR